MIGKNTIRLNQQTVVEAIQEYFDKRYEPGEGRKTKVVSVQAASGNTTYAVGQGEFDITTDTVTAPVPGKTE